MKNLKHFFLTGSSRSLRLLVMTPIIYLSIQTAWSTAPSNNLTARYTTLTKEVRCIVCQNQNLADSTAPLAQDLRHKIYTMLLDNQSDEEIKSYLVKRYGEFILLRPRWNQSTLLLWLFPWAAIGCILLFIIAK